MKTRDDYISNIADEIYAFLYTSGMSIEKFAEKADVSNVAVRNYLRKSKLACTENVTKMCRAMNITPNRLLGWEE